MAVSFIGGGNRRKPLTCHKSLTNFYYIMLYRVHLAIVGWELTTLVVLGTDCIGSCKSNYHMITTMMALIHSGMSLLLKYYWYLMPPSTMFLFIIAVPRYIWNTASWSILLIEETWVLIENQWPAASQWQTFIILCVQIKQLFSLCKLN